MEASGLKTDRLYPDCPDGCANAIRMHSTLQTLVQRRCRALETLLDAGWCYSSRRRRDMRLCSTACGSQLPYSMLCTASVRGASTCRHLARS